MATNAALLVEAEAAYHALMIGASARVVVDQNSERVEYTSANAGRLLAYIDRLKALIAAETGVSRFKGPAGVYF